MFPEEVVAGWPPYLFEFFLVSVIFLLDVAETQKEANGRNDCAHHSSLHQLLHG